MRKSASLPLLAAFFAALVEVATAAPDGSAAAGRGIDPAASLDAGRHRLAAFQWRMKTEMRIDDIPRLTKLEDVHLGPDGALVKAKTIRYERYPAPTPVASRDPRSGRFIPPTEGEDEPLFEQAQALMQLYARLSPAEVSAWAKGAALLPENSDRPGLKALGGRGLVRPLDNVVLYLDAATGSAREIEVKTTVSAKIVDIAFLRVLFSSKVLGPAGSPPVVAPESVYLNMTRGRRRVVLEMEMSDFRPWP